MRSLILLLIAAVHSFSFAQVKIEEGSAKFEADRILLEANDAGEEIYIPRSSDEALDVHHGYFHFKKSFQQVARVLSPEVEDEFDLFIFANVSYEKNGNASDYIPSQHMKVFRKKYAGQQVFRRDRSGQVVAHDPVLGDVLGHSDHQPALAGLPGTIVVSSGASHFGKGYVDTFSGVFRVNHRKSLARRFGQGMFHSLYIDIVYPSGRESGIAIHGTNKSRYHKLGTQASHGCIRTKQNVAKRLYEYVLAEDMYVPDLLAFDRRQRLPTGPLRETRPGYKALMIFFYGYDGNSGLAL